MAKRRDKLNIPDIAREAGVSPSTVSRVINRRAGVGEKTRKEITDILLRHGFRPKYPMMRTTKIAVIYPWINLTEYFRKVMDGIYSYAMDNELVVNTIIAGFNKKESLLAAIREQQCTGVVALLSEHYHNELEELVNADLPVVVIDSPVSNPRVGFVDNDSCMGSYDAARHLLSLGHKKIGYLTYSNMSLNQLQRFRGYKNALQAEGMAFCEDLVVALGSGPAESAANLLGGKTESGRAARNFSVRGDNGFKAMTELLARRPDITAVMAVDDSMALGAMSALHQAGLRIPEDISVVGFDNYAETKYWQPALTTVNHPLEQAGFIAIESIHSAFTDMAQWQPPREILATSLVVRSSTAQAKTS